MASNAFERSTNFENFIKLPQNMFRFLGVDMSIKPQNFSKYLQFATIVNIIFVTIHQIIYNFTTQDDNAQLLANITFTNYNLVGFGKILAIYYNRSKMANVVVDLKKIYPVKSTERKYRLEHYLSSYAQIEYLIWNFYRTITIFFLITPLMQSLMSLWRVGVFPLILPISVWSIVPMDESFIQYIVYYVLGSICCISVGVAITACDLCLYSMVTQLCVHFDLMSQAIMELPTENEEEALGKLYGIAGHHKEIVKLANAVNNIFGPSIIFSLMSSSFILCVVAYQMLDDVSIFVIMKAFILLMYESKQVIITCYFGNKLMDCSSLINVSLYMHRWAEGSLKYKRQVLFMLMCTMRPFGLNVFGIANISLITLKVVYGNAYQLFTVFKTT